MAGEPLVNKRNVNSGDKAINVGCWKDLHNVTAICQICV